MRIRTAICFSLLALIVFVKACNKSDHPVSNLAKETFFNAELTGPIETVRAFYTSHPKLKPTSDFAIRLPSSPISGDAGLASYEFADHPLLHEKGFLQLRSFNGFSTPVLLFFFKSFENAEKFYLDYVERLPGSSAHPNFHDKDAASNTAEEFVGKKKIALAVMLDPIPAGPGYQVSIQYLPRR
jgi:hypothetical protein